VNTALRLNGQADARPLKRSLRVITDIFTPGISTCNCPDMLPGEYLHSVQIQIFTRDRSKCHTAVGLTGLDGNKATLRKCDPSQNRKVFQPKVFQIQELSSSLVFVVGVVMRERRHHTQSMLTYFDSCLVGPCNASAIISSSVELQVRLQKISNHVSSKVADLGTLQGGVKITVVLKPELPEPSRMRFYVLHPPSLLGVSR